MFYNSLINRKLLFETEILCNIIYLLLFDQINLFLLIKSIHLFKTN